MVELGMMDLGIAVVVWILLQCPPVASFSDPIFIRACSVSVSAETLFISHCIGSAEPIVEAGWLGPDGTFWLAPGGTHAKVAARIIEGEWGGITDPARDYEHELERKRYVKLMVNRGDFTGWYRTSSRLTKMQQNRIVDWYLARERRIPEWVWD